MLDVYKSRYNLEGQPFRLSPDYRFSFGHRTYEDAMAYLKYAISEGEGFVAITGAPGTGKTTLLELISGVSSVDSGDIIVNGSPISKLHLPDIFRLGMARQFQENRIFMNMTVRENIMVAFPGNKSIVLFGKTYIVSTMVTGNMGSPISRASLKAPFLKGRSFPSLLL